MPLLLLVVVMVVVVVVVMVVMLVVVMLVVVLTALLLPLLLRPPSLVRSRAHLFFVVPQQRSHSDGMECTAFLFMCVVLPPQPLNGRGAARVCTACIVAAASTTVSSRALWDKLRLCDSSNVARQRYQPCGTTLKC